jgi:hypothetical protein
MATPKLNVSAFAEKHGVSRMTVLRRIAEGGLPAEKFILRPASPGKPERSEWLIPANAKIVTYQAGRPPKALEIEKAVGKAPPKRRPLAGAPTGKVVSIFGPRRRPR